MCNLVAALGKILRAVVENLRAIVRRSFRPRRGLARRLDRVANVLAIAQRSFPSNRPSAARTSML